MTIASLMPSFVLPLEPTAQLWVFFTTHCYFMLDINFTVLLDGSILLRNYLTNNESSRLYYTYIKANRVANCTFFS